MKDLIHLFPPDALPHLEKYLRGMIQDVHTKVIERDMHLAIDRQRKRDKETMALLIKRTMARIAAGMERETALAEGCEEPPYPTFASLEFFVRMAEKKAAAAARQARDAKIRWLVKTGLKNAEIAERLGVSTSTVAKAIKQGE